MLLVLNSVFSITEQECIAGGGTWVVPSYKEKPGPNEPTEPFCQCGEYKKGYLTQKWNGSACVNLTKEDICLRSNGQWIGQECVCNNGEWIEDVGCQFISHNTSYAIVAAVIAIVSIGIIFLIFTVIKRRHIR